MMQPQHEILFSPLTIKGRPVRNRIVAPPMVQLRPLDSREGLAWYRRLLAGRPGIVIVECTGVLDVLEKFGAAGLRPLARLVRDSGALAIIQLSTTRIGEPGNPRGRRDLPKDYTSEQIDQIVANYLRAAEVCMEAGFDGVEPHGAHNYMINLFFMPKKNRRPDEYGGDLENRCRLGVRVAEAARRGLGEGGLLFYRHTPVGGGASLDDSLVLAGKLLAAGVDVLDISPARQEVPADLAEPFRRFGVPVIAVQGMNDPDAAADALSAGRCDLVAIARGLIADARWPVKVQQDETDKIVRCVECNKGCFGNLEEQKPVHCLAWTKDEVAEWIL